MVAHFRLRTPKLPTSFQENSVASRFLSALKRLVTVIFVALAITSCAVGEYRIPYADGSDVDIRRDFVTHSSPRASMYDISVVEPPGRIVAAAAGWVRFIEDSNTMSGEGVEDNDDYGNNNYVWIEHPQPFCQDPDDPERATWPRKPANYDQTCRPCNRRFCNEWTVYAHMSPGSVTGTGPNSAGLQEGDWVEAGRFLGIEDDIGFAAFVHLHWHVAVIDPAWTPSRNGDYESFLDGRRPEVIPLVCTPNGDRVLWRDTIYTAVSCP